MKTYFKHYEALEKLLNQIDLYREDFCIVGGTSLNIANIRGHGDIDLCIRPILKNELIEKYSDKYMISKKKSIKFNNKIEAHKGDVFSTVDISDDELIDNPKYHYIYEGFKVAKLELVYSKKLYKCTKRRSFRRKDLYDVYLINKKKASIKSWDQNLLVFQRSKKEKILSVFAILVAKIFAILPKSINVYKV